MACGQGFSARGAGVGWRLAVALALLLSLLAGALARVPAAGAATCVVTSLADSGVGTLRAALGTANCAAIIFQAGLTGTIELADDLPTLARAVSVTGPGAALLTVERNDTLGGLVFRLWTGGDLTLTGLTVAFADIGIRLVANSRATVTDSTFSVNSYGMFFDGGGTATVTDSTLSNYGTGLQFDHGGEAMVANSTFVGTGIGLGFFEGGAATVINSTLTGNGSGLSFNGGGSASLANTLLAQGSGYNCFSFETSGNVTNATSNLADDATCFAAGANGSRVVARRATGLDPAGLADHGGPTRTIALLPASPARDVGDAATCAAAPVNGMDQRGATRPQDAGCDIGAYEFVPNDCAALFSDVANDDPACPAIFALVRDGVIKGYATDPPTFGPDDLVQRAQGAAFLVRALGWEARATGPRDFDDFDGLVQELQDAVRILANACQDPAADATCVARGYGDGRFGPPDPVSHAQAIALIARAFMLDPATAWVPAPSGCAPPASVPAVHAADVCTYVANAGAIPGAPTTPAGWDAPASRAWVAVALWQALQPLP